MVRYYFNPTNSKVTSKLNLIRRGGKYYYITSY